MNKTLLLLLLFCAHIVSAQHTPKHRYLEGGIMLGLSNYSGDVAERIIEIAETRPGFGAFARYHFGSLLAIKVNLYTGNLSGTDAHAISPDIRARSLTFKSNLLEYSIVTEWNVLNIKPVTRNGLGKFQIIPYLYFGVGGVLIHPKVVYYGPPEAIDERLRASIPEPGHGLSEKAMTIPVGGGLRTRLNDSITLGVEGGWHPVFSDYLDGVSLNGGPKHDDWFYSAVATLSFDLNR